MFLFPTSTNLNTLMTRNKRKKSEKKSFKESEKIEKLKN